MAVKKSDTPAGAEDGGAAGGAGDSMADAALTTKALTTEEGVANLPPATDTPEGTPPAEARHMNNPSLTGREAVERMLAHPADTADGAGATDGVDG